MSPPVFTCYTDAIWPNDTSTRSSNSGNVFLSGTIPSPDKQRQNCIALSSSESEYIVAAQAAQEIQSMILFLKDLRLEQQ
ncbi:hypothetical protein NPIL_511881 [Nephila pilipes]|uniref:Uncharacterized protein n=1 Tax=Nephila pilipes TaxID=299642 RepID=A0A8X6R7Q9_NEPPI|nr:hypothetical protein NPIL_511881 [Nephila pilipes]